jgi:hypothetical protein
VNFTPLLAKRLLRRLGALDVVTPEPTEPTPSEGVTAEEARRIAADVVLGARLTLTPSL